MNNSIELRNQNILDIKKCRETTNELPPPILPQKIPPQVAKLREPLATPSILILT